MFAGQTNTPATSHKKKHPITDTLNSNQQVVPVTWYAGRRLITAQRLSACYNQVNQEVDSGGGDKVDGPKQYIYFADYGVMWNVCGRRRPNDAIFKLVLDGNVHWKNDAGLYRDTADYDDITTKRGTMRLYWGTGTQPQDPLVFTTRGAIPIDPNFKKNDPSTWPPDYVPGQSNPLAGHYDRHPRYLYQSYSVFKRWRLGKSKTQAPQLIAELGRGVPWFAADVGIDRAAMGLDFDARGVNPIGAIYELITDEMFGLGRTMGAFSGAFTDAELHQASWETALQQFPENRISPFLTQQTDAKSLFSELLEYVDGYLRDINGKLAIGYWDHGPIDLTKLPILTDDDLDGESEVAPGDIEDTDATTWFNYNDKDHYYNDRPVKVDDPVIRRQGGNAVPVVEDRKFFTDQATVKKYASEWYASKRQIPQKGPLPIKREWLDDNATAPDAVTRQIQEGDRFLWQSAKYGLQEALRINELEWPEDRSGQVKLEVEYERAGGTAQKFVPPAVIDLSPDFVIEPVEITNRRVVELPSGLKTLSAIQVAILAQRPRAETVGFGVFVSVDNTTFDPALSQSNFAAFGKVAAVAYPNNTNDIDTAVGLTVDLYGYDQDTIVTSQTDTQRADKNVLIFFGNEIASLGQITALGGGRFNIKMQRALYGTVKATHFIDENVWFIPRDRLVPIDNKNFAQGTTRYFKLRPYTLDDILDLSSVSSFSFNFANAPAVGSVFNMALSSVAGVAADNTPDVRIVVKWDGLLDQDIYEFEVAWQKVGDAAWQSESPFANPTGHNLVDFEATPNTNYNVRITPMNSHGEPGSPVTQQILTTTLSPFRPVGLELAGQGNDTISTQPDFVFAWRLNSPAANSNNAGNLVPGVSDPHLDVYLVEIYAGEESQQRIVDAVPIPVWKDSTVTPLYRFPIGLNRLLDGGPFAKITAAVYAKDSLGRVSAPEVLTVENLKPGTIRNPSISSTLSGLVLGWDWPSDRDIAELVIRGSSDPFDPAPPIVGREAFPGTSHAINLVTDTAQYFWGTVDDTFTNESTAVMFGSVTPGSIVGPVIMTPAGGNINGPTTVQLECPETTNAQIYYRNDNQIPTTADALYDASNPPSVSADGDFSARAFLSGSYGPVNTKHFTLVVNGVDTPQFGVPPGTYPMPSGTKDIPVSTVNGTSMRYTTGDGTQAAPDLAGTTGTLISAATGNITLPTGHTVILLRAYRVGWTTSAIATGDFTITQSGGGSAVPDPTCDTLDGTYDHNISIQLLDSLAGAQIRFTKGDGTQAPPTSTTGTLYTGPISLTAPIGAVRNFYIKAIAIKTGLPNSNVITFYFQIDRS